MELGLLPSGLFLGFSLAIGVGPVNVLCIRRALSEGLSAGLWSGFGAAVADAIFALIVGLGLAAVSSVVRTHAWFLQIGGAVFLIGWGLKVALTRIEAGEGDKGPARVVAWGLSTFLLTLLNPANLATFGLAASGLGLVNAKLEATSVSLLVVGVFAGSMAWWSALTGLSVRLRDRFVGGLLPMVNRIAGLLIIAFGIALLLFDPGKLPGGAKSAHPTEEANSDPASKLD